jgi:hypothetical protein
MSYYCELCNYISDNKYNLDKHNKSKKHLTNQLSLNDDNDDNIKIYICDLCNCKIKHQSSYSRHIKICKNKKIKVSELKMELELEKLKHKVEIQDLKIQNQDLKIKHLQDNNISTINITNNIDSHNTTTNISKLENLNMNYGKVIDMKTFTKNFNTKKYGLNEKDVENLLYLCKNGTIETITSSIMYYVKESMRKQFEDKFNIPLSNDNVMMPYVAGDMSLRYHYEKISDKEWCKTSSNNNIKNLVNLTERQVYEHQKESIILNGYQKRRVVNGMIKESSLDTDMEQYK